MTGNKQVWLKLRADAEALGLAVVSKPWPGNGAPGVAYARNALDLAHELGHCMLATEAERKLPWYGLDHPLLGDIWHDTPDTDKRLISPRIEERRELELAAKALSVVLLRDAGASRETILKYMRDEGPGMWWAVLPPGVRRVLGTHWDADKDAWYEKLVKSRRAG